VLLGVCWLGVSSAVLVQAVLARASSSVRGEQCCLVQAVLLGASSAVVCWSSGEQPGARSAG